ncbi:MAG: peptidase S14 [Desulfovibrionaceae bacterium]|nr:MAG: peptidase S14 [Desulfovibrionaceae bacterium]
MLKNKKSFRDLMACAEQDAKNRIASGQPLRLSPQAKADGDEATIYLYDAIGGWFGIAAADFVQELNGLKAKTIHLRINSPGGSVFEAEAIQTAIQQHTAKVVAHVDGMAASAATYVALAADEIEISDGAMFMIHRASGLSWGNAEDLLHLATLLEKIDANIVSDYQRKTGKSPEQLMDWMKAETWFSAAEALENGFVDRIYTKPKPTDDGGGKDKQDDGKKAQAQTDALKLAAQRRANAIRMIGIGI